MTAPIVEHFVEKISKVKHKYCGTIDENGFRIGANCQEWLVDDIIQNYCGQFLYNNLQNKGIYLINKKGDQTYYDGLFYCNKFEGYGKVFYADNTIFEGLFNQHVRFGPGIVTYPDDTQDVGMWDGFFLKRIIVTVGQDFVPRLAKTSVGKARLLKYRQLVPICVKPGDLAKEILTQLNAEEEIIKQSNQLYNKHVRNPDSLFFDRKLYCENFSKDECTIDVVISQEEFEQSVSGSEQTLENGCEAWNETPLQNGCGCFQLNVDRFGHICHQLHDVELKLEKLMKKREGIEEQMNKCQECCENINRIREFEFKKEQEHAKDKSDFSEITSESSKSNGLNSQQELCYSPSFSETEGEGLYRSAEIELKSFIYAHSAIFTKAQDGNFETENTSNYVKFQGYITELSGEVDDFTYEPPVCLCDDLLIENIDILQKKLKSLKQEEMFYMIIKINLKKHLDIEFEKLDHLEKEENRFIKKVVVTDLLAWNNEETWIEMLQHCFRHKMSEDIVSFNARDLLLGNRHYFKSPGFYERNCKKFLEECSEGNDKNIITFLTTSNIHPDLCDGKGNSGLMLATIRDKINVMAILINCGARVDVMNDECLTPLTISFLKYLSFKFKVGDWEKAFMEAIKLHDLDVQQWRPAESFQSLYDNVLPKSSTDTDKEQSIAGTLQHGKSNDNMAANNVKPEHDIPDLHSKIMLVTDLQNEQKYIFDLSYIRAPPKKQEKLQKINRSSTKDKKKNKKKVGKGDSVKSKKGKKSRKKETDNVKNSIHDEHVKMIEDNIVNKLEIIKKTIMTLLHHCSDPNIGTVPLKPIFLAVFTDDSDFMNALLTNKANPNDVTSEHNLTSLHVIASLKPTLHRLRMFELLLHFKADPNIRTNSDHWSQLKRETLGKNIEDVTNEGKNVLHLLSMREDYIDDSHNLLGYMAKLLVLNGCKTGDFYLGHTPLSLAVLHGNNKLIKSLLTTKKVDPHQVLGNDMGNALTILVLNRFSSGLRLDEKKSVVKNLLDYGLNPLHRIGSFENAVSFMEHEYHSAQLGRQSSTNISKKTAKKALKKKKKKGKSLKSSKSSKPASSVNLQSVENYIVDSARKILFRHLQGKAVQYLYMLVGESFIVDPLVVALAKFVTTREALNIINLLFQHGIFRAERFSYSAIWDVLEFIRIQDNAEQLSNSQRRKLEEKIKDMSWKRIVVESQDLYLPFPEVDENVDKYKVCFQCLKSEDKRLLKCPSCELVYFCSEECNILSKNTGIYHNCTIVFYQKVETIIQTSLQPSRMHFMLNMANEAEMTTQTQAKDVNLKYKSAKILDSRSQNSKKIGPGDDSPKNTEFILNSEIQAGIRELTNLQTTAPTMMSFKEYETKFLEQIASDAKHEYSAQILASTSSNLVQRARPGRRSSLKRSPSSSPKNTSTVLFDLQPRRLSYFLNNRQPLTSRKISEMTRVHQGQGQGSKTNSTLEETKNYYMEVLSKIFADFNLPLLLLPYACFKDGQVYYKLNGDRSSFGSGFHKLIPD